MEGYHQLIRLFWSFLLLLLLYCYEYNHVHPWRSKVSAKYQRSRSFCVHSSSLKHFHCLAGHNMQSPASHWGCRDFNPHAVRRTRPGWWCGDEAKCKSFAFGIRLPHSCVVLSPTTFRCIIFKIQCRHYSRRFVIKKGFRRRGWVGIAEGPNLNKVALSKE